MTIGTLWERYQIVPDTRSGLLFPQPCVFQDVNVGGPVLGGLVGDELFNIRYDLLGALSLVEAGVNGVEYVSLTGAVQLGWVYWLNVSSDLDPQRL